MDGVGISIIERPRPLHNHDTPNSTQHPYTLKCEEPFIDYHTGIRINNVLIDRIGKCLRSKERKITSLSISDRGGGQSLTINLLCFIELLAGLPTYRFSLSTPF